MRIIVFTLISMIHLAIAALGLLILLLTMNGYSEQQATPSLVFYILVSLAGAPGLGVAGVLVAKRLIERKSFSSMAASATAIISFTILSAPILIAGFSAALVLVEVIYL